MYRSTELCHLTASGWTIGNTWSTSKKGLIWSLKRFVPSALHKSLHPRTLSLCVSQLIVEISMRIAVDTVLGSAIRLSFIGIVESRNRQSTSTDQGQDQDLLVSAIFVRSRGRPDHVSGGRLAHSLRNEPWQDSHVQDVASGDESARGRGRKLCKAQDGLLRGKIRTVDVDSRIAAKIVEREREGVVGRCEVNNADCGALVDR